MQKIFIVGIVASGKTTLAKKISKHIEVPWYELDGIVHYQTHEGRVKRNPQEQMEVIKEIDRHGQWIFEGTDRESYQYLYEMADTIIFLDTPLWKRRFRIVTRYVKQQVGMEKAHYKSDLKMLKMMFTWTNEFERNRAVFENKMCLYRDKVIRVTDNKTLNYL